MTEKKELTIEDKLRSLYRLQLIDSRIDTIKNVRGELPLEVKDLETEISFLSEKVSNLKKDVANLEIEINNKKNSIEESKELSKKYTKQQESVRNNREFDSLTKEIEFQNLEIELAEKQINEYRKIIDKKIEFISSITEKLERQSSHLANKKAELDSITKETEKEEKLMNTLSQELAEKIDENLLKTYSKIRSSVKNGLAVVSTERGTTGGSFFVIPPQLEIEIASRNKITIDEYSGRILIDAELAEEERKALKNILT